MNIKKKKKTCLIACMYYKCMLNKMFMCKRMILFRNVFVKHIKMFVNGHHFMLFSITLS